MKNLRVYLVFTSLLLALNLGAKVHQLKDINLQINLEDSWVLKNKENVDAIFLNTLTGQAIVIHRQPLLSVNSVDDLPTNYDELKSYYYENLLSSQLEKIAPFFNEDAIFYDKQKFNQLEGPLVLLTGSTNKIPLNMFIWTAWAGQGAYYISFVSTKKQGVDINNFKQTFESIEIIDENKNPFVQTNSLKLTSEKPTQNDTFNIEFSQFKSYSPIASKEIGLNDDEDIMSLILVHMANGDFITSIPHCYQLTEEQKNFVLKTYANSMLETQFESSQVTIEGKPRTVMFGDGIDEDIEQLYVHLVIKEIHECAHLISIASSNPFVDFESIKLAYEHLKPIKDQVVPVNYSTEQQTAFSYYFIGLGITAEEEGNLEPLAFYEAAYEINPNVDTLNYLLDQLNSKKQYIKGLSVLSAVNEELEHNHIIKSWHAWFLTKTEAYGTAINKYEELFNSTYSSDEDFFNFVEALEKKQLWEKTYQIIKTHLPSINKRSTGLGLLVKYAGLAEAKEDTLNAMNMAMDEQRIDLNNIYDIMDGLYEINEIEPLLVILNKQLKTTPDNLGLWYYKGDILFTQSKFEESLDAMEKALALSPKHEKVLAYIENIKEYLGLGNYQLISENIDAVPLPKIVSTQIESLKPVYNKNDAEYLYAITASRFKVNETIKTSYYKKIKINNAKGVKHFKTITFEYDEDYEKVYINEFKVIDANGNLIQKLDPKSIYITNSEDGVQADDDMVINIPVPQISEGVFIEYTITTESVSKKTEIPFNRYFFISAYPTQNKTILVTGDVNKLIGISKSPLKTINNSELKVWTMTDVPQYIYYEYMPKLEEISDWLIINPIDKDWSQIGLNYMSLIESKLNTTISKGQSLAIFSDSTTPNEKVESAVKYIQESINYQALEFGSRALIPNDSKTTLKNKYGDCKDHAVLLYDLLNSQGIKAEIALVETSRKLVSAAPSLDQFNHAIVYLPEIDGGTFIDTTDKDIAFGIRTPPQSVQGSTALVLSKDKPYLKPIPLITAEHNKLLIEREVKKEFNHLLMNETIQLTGYLASGFRYYIKNSKSSEIEQKIQSWISSTYSNIELLSFEYYGLTDNQKPFIIEIQSKLTVDEDALILPVFFEKNYLDQTRSTKRPVGFQIHEAFSIESSTKILPPLTFNDDIINKGLENHTGLSWHIETKQGSLNFRAISQPLIGSSDQYNPYVDNIKSSIKLLERSVK